MHFLLILLVTCASCAILPTYENDYVILPQHLEFYDRNKRDVGIHKGDNDKYTINFNKDLVKDDDKKLSVFGMIDGLERNTYDSIKTGFDFKNS